MKAVFFTGDRNVEVADTPDPTPGPGEVVIQIKASGMCGSDLNTLRAPAGSRPRLIAGHEPCGIVAAVGPDVSPKQARVGDRVMDHHYSGCGVCIHCRDGWTQLCEDGSTVYGNTGHGSHAEYMLVPAYTCIPLPEELSFSAGAAISCGTGTAYGGLMRLGLSGRDTIAIFGQGPVGLSGTQLAAAMGARVISLDIESSRRDAALGFGADAVIDPRAEDPVEALRELTGGRGVDCVLDCTSSAEARLQGARACKVWGRICYVGMGGEVTYDVSNDVIKKQLTIVGSWTFSQNGQAECARFCVDRNIDVDALFSHRWSLDEAPEAYVMFDRQNTGKGVFEL
ncbi:MAG: zinc-binding dehydrogenase [Pseudomonadota bacterium]